MAEFSKESSSDFNDFSIKEEFQKLEEGYLKTIICEHFGFSGIARNKGKCLVGFSTNKGDKWYEFDFETNTIGKTEIII